MMFNRFYNMEMMNASASAPSANVDSSCAHTARTSHTANTAMIAIMDAIIMASIIIFGLIMILGLRAIAMIAIIIAILVLVVGLVIQKVNVPWCCELAIQLFDTVKRLRQWRGRFFV